VLVVVAGAAVTIGWTQGFLRPVFAELALVLAVALVAIFHAPLLALVAPHLDLPPDLILIASAIGLAFVLNVPASRLSNHFAKRKYGNTDRVLGVGLQLGSAMIVIYLALSTTTHAEAAVRPLLASGPGHAITPGQVEGFAAGVQKDALLSALVRPEQLAADRADARTGHLTLQVVADQLPWVRLYVGIRPAVVGSHLAPVVLRFGDRLPLVGR
jgi:hypothetical protein